MGSEEETLNLGELCFRYFEEHNPATIYCVVYERKWGRKQQHTARCMDFYDRKAAAWDAACKKISAGYDVKTVTVFSRVNNEIDSNEDWNKNPMQTHDNSNHSDFMNKLRERAAEAEKKGTGSIAAGADEEAPLAVWKASNGIHCRHMPDDPQGLLRISVGGGDHLPVTLNYASIRGNVGQCIALLEKALVALRECPE